jgi:hypothetical protein
MTKKLAYQEVKLQNLSMDRREQRNIMRRVAAMAHAARIQQKRG